MQNPSSWHTIAIGVQSEPERLATLDLQRYLAQATGVLPGIVDVGTLRTRPQPAVIVGTLASFPLPELLSSDADTLGEEGYVLERCALSGREVIVAAGRTPRGTVNAIYGLLRELGFRFYLGSEAIPDALPPSLPVEHVSRSPVLKIRGILPWYNFFNSPTAWDPADHRAVVDQLVRMGANFIGFHAYDFEPFAAYEEDGQVQWGKRLLNTASATWGTHPRATRDFACRTDRLYADEYFGATTTHLDAEERDVVRLEQDILRDALDYAARRGLHTCLGFEMNGDPTQAQYRDAFLKRLNHVLDQYPALDMLWLWQSETQGVLGFPEEYPLRNLGYARPPQTPLLAYGKARRDVFRRVVEAPGGAEMFFKTDEAGKIDRAVEGARLEQFAQLALRALAHRDNPPRLVLSGWGGEGWLLGAEYYEGLDRLLPHDVVFSALDQVWPRHYVDPVYRALPPTRERWPILWLENDGDQWHPQPFVHLWEATVRDLHRGGCQGVLGILWRTRDVEENLSYLNDYAWNPDLTAEKFFGDLAQHCYGEPIAQAMAEIHSELDSLGYRWILGKGQNEHQPFIWGEGDDAHRARLEALRGRAGALLARARRRALPRLEWLIAEMDWVLAFDNAQKAAREAETLLKQAQETGNEQAARDSARQALERLSESTLARALWTYSRRLSTRGEYGVLATINTKAVVAWEELEAQARDLLGTDAQPNSVPEWEPEPRMLLPRFLGSVPAHAQLTLFPIVLGGETAWMHYRPLGRNEWASLPLEPVRGWVCRACIPARGVPPPGIELAFSFSPDPNADANFGPVGVSAFPETGKNITPRKRIPLRTPPADLRLHIQGGKATPAEVVWQPLIEADFFRVYRNDLLAAETAVPVFPDETLDHGTTYRVEAVRDGAVIAVSESASIDSAGLEHT